MPALPFRRAVPVLPLLLAACGGAPATAPRPAPAADAIVPPFPASVTERLSWLLDGDEPPRWSVIQVVDGAGESTLLLGRRDGARPDGPTWRVVATLALPRDAGDVLLPGTCRRAGVKDPRVVALARAGAGDSLRAIRRAWLADTARGRFSAIASEGLACENPA